MSIKVNLGAVWEMETVNFQNLSVGDWVLLGRAFWNGEGTLAATGPSAPQVQKDFTQVIATYVSGNRILTQDGDFYGQPTVPVLRLKPNLP